MKSIDYIHNWYVKKICDDIRDIKLQKHKIRIRFDDFI